MTCLHSHLFSFNGQSVQSFEFENTEQKLIVKCRRDRRFKCIDPETGTAATINRYIRRKVHDLPVSGRPCVIDIELAQVRGSDSRRIIEHCDFVVKGSRYTRRFCQMISGLCRHMSIQTVSRHLNIRWETVKNIDKQMLAQSLPSLNPATLKDLTLIGVDEVARAKGHDYMTVVYDMVSGQLIWVEHGRTADVLMTFLNQLPKQTANGIKAVAMDMGKAYQKAVRTSLPNADIVFDRFHVMQNFSKVIQRQRRTEFRKATNRDEKGLIKGSLYLLLMNAEKMSDKQSDKLDALLEGKQKLVYALHDERAVKNPLVSPDV